MNDDPSRTVWAWFRPPAAAEGVFVQIPPETYQSAASGLPLTLRNIAWSVGVDPVAAVCMSIYGTSCDCQGGTNPYWDHVLTDPGTVSDRTIGFFLPAATAAAPTFVPATGSASPISLPGDVNDLFLRIESDWQASLQLEIQTAALSLQLKGTFARVNSLNRDLTSEEARFADQRDKADWQDARRWLRDVSDRMSRFMKDYQTGDTSIAGKRSQFEFLYENYVLPRRAFPGLEQMAREFESHRKSLQVLLNNMSQAQNSASQDGERRAQQILQRMAAKTRSARTRR